MFKIIIFGLIFYLNLSPLYAEQKTVNVTGRAVISDGVTLFQAKHQAINHARSLAVEQAAGVNVQSAMLLKNSLVISEFVKTLTYGFLVKEDIINWKGDWVKTKSDQELGLPVISVTINAQVKVPNKSFFHNYGLEAKLNKQVFQNGESIQLDIQARENMYILVVNYTSDNKIIPIFPFNKNSDNLLPENKQIQLPGTYHDEFSIAVNNYPGHKKDTEAFIIIGVGINNETAKIPWNNLFKRGKEISFPDFFQTLLNLPIPWIAEKTLVYTVFDE